MSNPSSTSTINAASDSCPNNTGHNANSAMESTEDAFSREQAFQAATAATVRALGLAPTHEIHFGRLFQSGPELTEFPVIADDALLRGMADMQAAALRFAHDYDAADMSALQKEFFSFLEEARRAACLGRYYTGARNNILYLWQHNPVIDFVHADEENAPPAGLLNHVLMATRQMMLGLDASDLPVEAQDIIRQMRTHCFVPETFLADARALMTLMWQSPDADDAPNATQEAPRAVSHSEEDTSNDEHNSPLALQEGDEPDTPPPASGSAPAEDSAFKSDATQSDEGDYHGWHNPLTESETALARYHVYTTAYDEIVFANTLLSTSEQQKLRHTLDTQLQPFQRLVHKLAQQLQRQLQSWEATGWQRGLDDGMLDLHRITRVRTHHSGVPMIYKQPHLSLARDCVVTLLLDNSGSMRGKPILITALCADILAHTLERCGVKVEILGYTTRQWKGGQAMRDWADAGKPQNPGRLNELRHVVYKSADQSWRQARLGIATMLKEGLLKENIDGEALLWAHGRLLKRREKRKIMMVISDGAPVDDATLAANRPDYLEEHLHDTISWISLMKKIELVAIGIGHDVTRYYPRATVVKDIETLAQTMLDELSQLLRRG